MRWLRVAGKVVLLTFISSIHAQPGVEPAFEVVSVKVNKNGGADGFFPAPGGLRVNNLTLSRMIEYAYGLNHGSQLSGATGWMNSAPYDIDARTKSASTFDDELVMLRAVLSDRFHLRFHRELRQLPMYAMVAAKNGPKLQPSKEGAPPGRMIVQPGIISGRVSPGYLASILAAQLRAPVVNQTGISGNFDVTLKYARDDSTRDSDQPSIFIALQEQLGLKLEARKGPVDLLVVEHVEKTPTAN